MVTSPDLTAKTKPQPSEHSRNNTPSSFPAPSHLTLSMPVKYSDPGVEPHVDNEEALTREIISIINRVQDHNFSLHRHGFRGTHVKTQGVVKGKLTVPSDLPSDLAVGICAQPGTYDCAIRYANEPSFLQDDRAAGPRGCGMKVFTPTVQDFTFNNAPILELRDLPTTVQIFRIRERHFREPEKIKPEIEKRDDKDLQMAPMQLPNQHFLSYEMFSQSAYQWGDLVVKYGLFPTTKVDPGSVEDSEQHSKWLQQYFEKHEMTYDFRLQICQDLEKQPVEDASVEWAGEWTTVAQVVLPKQDSWDAKRRAFWDDHMKLNVWAGYDEHRPLGSVNRLRRTLYDAAQKKRAKLNAVDKIEAVKSVDEIP